MNKLEEFRKLWNDHWVWNKGILMKDIIETDLAMYYFSEVPGVYYNFCIPKTSKASDFDLERVEAFFKENNRQTCVVLFEEQQALGYTEHALRSNLVFEGTDSWVLYDTSKELDAPKIEIREVTPETYLDYYKVLSAVFSDFPGNDKYMDICFKTIKGELKNPSVPDLQSKLYIIYENEIPVAGGGLFFSKEKNIAYLHDGGTLQEYRGKGYQTSLLKHRTSVALTNGISRIYSSVEQGSKSWSNCIKCDFTQFHNSFIFKGKEERNQI